MSPRARTARRPAAPVEFRGPPHRLSSIVQLPAAADALGEPRALLEGAEIRGLGVRALTPEGPGVAKLTLRLPKSTPPGTYSGSVELGSRAHPVVVEVEPRAKVEASPPRLTVEADPGAEVNADVTLLNVGNVPFEIPAASTFCVFDGSGVDRALWAAFKAEPPKGTARIDVLLDELAQSHGGLVEVRARTKNRTIAPGESGNVQLTLRFSDRLRPGGRYAGAWDADGLHVRVGVSVPSKGRRR